MPDPTKSLAENMRKLAAGAGVWADFLRALAVDADARRDTAAATSLRAIAGMLHYVSRSAAALMR